MLEIRHLRTLAALRSAGSLVRAAQLLNLTQSALSHQIKLLEDRYGGPLFERKTVPIGFTAMGADRSQRAARASVQSGRCARGTPPGIC